MGEREVQLVAGAGYISCWYWYPGTSTSTDPGTAVPAAVCTVPARAAVDMSDAKLAHCVMKLTMQKLCKLHVE